MTVTAIGIVLSADGIASRKEVGHDWRTRSPCAWASPACELRHSHDLPIPVTADGHTGRPIGQIVGVHRAPRMGRHRRLGRRRAHRRRRRPAPRIPRPHLLLGGGRRRSPPRLSDQPRQPAPRRGAHHHPRTARRRTRPPVRRRPPRPRPMAPRRDSQDRRRGDRHPATPPRRQRVPLRHRMARNGRRSKSSDALGPVPRRTRRRRMAATRRGQAQHAPRPRPQRPLTPTRKPCRRAKNQRPRFFCARPPGTPVPLPSRTNTGPVGRGRGG